MKLETVVLLLGVGTAFIALFQGYDWWKNKQSKSSINIVDSAIQLLKPYQQEVEELRASLQKANTQIYDLTQTLNAAETRANILNNRLADAQSEVGYLRTQVKILSQQLGDDSGRD